MNLFAKRLKYLRTQNNLTQKNIADYLGIKETSYRKYEYADREPSYDTLIKLCTYFNVSTDYLLGASEVKENNDLINKSDLTYSYDIQKTSNSSFNARLKELRIKNKLTQKDIAEYLEITRTSYQVYEHSNKEPNYSTVIKLSNYFNVSIDYLLGISDLKVNIIDEVITELHDLLLSVGVHEPNKKLSPKAKERLFNLIKNNTNLIIESNDKII